MCATDWLELNACCSAVGANARPRIHGKAGSEISNAERIKKIDMSLPSFHDVQRCCRLSNEAQGNQNFPYKAEVASPPLSQADGESALTNACPQRLSCSKLVAALAGAGAAKQVGRLRNSLMLVGFWRGNSVPARGRKRTLDDGRRGPMDRYATCLGCQ